MRTSRFTKQESELIADHLLDCELRGITMGGFSRAISVIERYGKQPENRDPMIISRETAFSAAIESDETIGYLVGHKATEMAIEKAKETGMGMVGAHCAIFSGMLSYYAEMVTAKGLVCFSTSSTGLMVAPEGGTEARFGTNPICMGFPSADDPIIWDIGTSGMMLADAVLAKNLNQPLPDGVAYDAEGARTTDPTAALEGAFRVWGGHKGSGLALSVQLMGMMVGANAMPDRYGDIGFFLIAIDPKLFTDPATFYAEVKDYADAIRRTRPEIAERPLRLPFDRSRAQRNATLEAGVIDVPKEVLAELQRLIK